MGDAFTSRKVAAALGAVVLAAAPDLSDFTSLISYGSARPIHKRGRFKRNHKAAQSRRQPRNRS